MTFEGSSQPNSICESVSNNNVEALFLSGIAKKFTYSYRSEAFPVGMSSALPVQKSWLGREGVEGRKAQAIDL